MTFAVGICDSSVYGLRDLVSFVDVI